MKRSKHDVPAENECRDCEGQGVTRFTAPELNLFDDKVTGEKTWETIKQGSGCPNCLGVGRV